MLFLRQGLHHTNFCLLQEHIRASGGVTLKGYDITGSYQIHYRENLWILEPHFRAQHTNFHSCHPADFIHIPLSCRKTLTTDKGGIEITSDPVSVDGKVVVTVDHLRESFVVRFHINNKGPDCVHFTYYTALHKIRCFTLEDERRVTRVCPLFLCPGKFIELSLLIING